MTGWHIDIGIDPSGTVAGLVDQRAREQPSPARPLMRGL
jgi:hypothetical protein